MLLIFLLISIPMGCFCLWFAWKAHNVGKKHAVYAMSWVAFLCFGSALLFGGWAYIMTIAE